MHSAIDRAPGETIEVDGHLVDIFDVFGKLKTRFKARGCRGDCGNEFDLRSVFRVDPSPKFLETSVGCKRAGALALLLRALRAAFITSVARIDLSLGLS